MTIQPGREDRLAGRPATCGATARYTSRWMRASCRFVVVGRSSKKWGSLGARPRPTSGVRFRFIPSGPYDRHSSSTPNTGLSQDSLYITYVRSNGDAGRELGSMLLPVLANSEGQWILTLCCRLTTFGELGSDVQGVRNSVEQLSIDRLLRFAKTSTPMIPLRHGIQALGTVQTGTVLSCLFVE